MYINLAQFKQLKSSDKAKLIRLALKWKIKIRGLRNAV